MSDDSDTADTGDTNPVRVGDTVLYRHDKVTLPLLVTHVDTRKRTAGQVSGIVFSGRAGDEGDLHRNSIAVQNVQPGTGKGEYRTA